MAVFKIPQVNFDYTIGVQPYSPGEPNVTTKNPRPIIPIISPVGVIEIWGGFSGVPTSRGEPQNNTVNAPDMGNYMTIDGIVQKSKG